MGDILPTFITMLNDNWDATIRKPSLIDELFDQKFTNVRRNDAILVYETGQTREPFGLGASVFQVRYNISCDIYTTEDRERAVQLRDELIDCVRTELKDNGVFIVVTRVIDKCNEIRKIYRYIVDCEYVDWETI